MHTPSRKLLVERSILCVAQPHHYNVVLPVNFLDHNEYEERVQLLKLDSLSCRLNTGDMVMVFKILHGSLEGIQWCDFFQMADTSRLRGHFIKLKKERSMLDLRKFTFFQRVVNMWNDLPADIVTAPMAKVFKKLLEAHF